MERTLIRVDLVIRTKHELDPDVDHLVAGEETTLHRVADSLLDRLDEFLRNRTAGDLVFEHETLAGRRLDLDLDVTKLTTPTGLLLVNFFSGRRLRNRLAIRNLRLADVCFDAKLALHAVDDDLEVQLAHAGDDRLPRFLIGRDVERRIFLGQTVQSDAELVLVLSRLGFDRDADNWSRKLHRLEHDRLILIRNRVAGGDLLHTADGDDLAGARR